MPGPLMDRRGFLRAGALVTLGATAAACSKGTTAVKPSPTPSGRGSSSPTPTTPLRPLAWRRLGAAGPKARSHHSFSANAEGSIAFLFGGKQGATALRDAWAFDRSNGLWQPLPYGPPARFNHTSTFVDGHWVLYGGQNGSHFYNDAWAFDSIQGKWIELPPGSSKPAARAGASGTAIGNALTISHGVAAKGRLNDTWAISARWTNVTPRSGPRPAPRSFHRAEFVTGPARMVLFGGQGNSAAFLADTWLYDPTKLAWTRVDVPAPTARNLYTSAATATRMYVFGGASKRGPLRDLWSFDGHAWRPLKAAGTPPRARSAADGAVIAGPTMLMFGGTDGAKEFADLWELTLPA